MIANRLVEIAKREVGVREDPVNSNCGGRVNEYKAATNLPPKKAWPWCAAFVDWCVREAMKGKRWTFKRPTTASAWDLENWSLAQDDSTQTKRGPKKDIQPGDIVIYTFSHVGIAVSFLTDKGMLLVVEGNTNKTGSREGDGVYLKMRHISDIKTRIRFTV